MVVLLLLAQQVADLYPPEQLSDLLPSPSRSGASRSGWPPPSSKCGSPSGTPVVLVPLVRGLGPGPCLRNRGHDDDDDDGVGDLGSLLGRRGGTPSSLKLGGGHRGGVGGVRLKRRSASLEPDPLLREGAPASLVPAARLGSQTHAGPHVVVPLEGYSRTSAILPSPLSLLLLLLLLLG